MASVTADTSNQELDNSWYAQSIEEFDYSGSNTAVTEGQQPLEFEPFAPPISVLESVPHYPPLAIDTAHHHIDPPSVVLPPMYIQQPTWTPMNLIPRQPSPPFPTTCPVYYPGYSTFVPAPISMPSYVKPPPQSVMIDVGYPLTIHCNAQDTPVFYEAPSTGMIGTQQQDYMTTFNTGFSNDQLVLSENLYAEQKMSFPFLPNDVIHKVISLGNEITTYFNAYCARFLNHVLQESLNTYVLFVRKPSTGQCWVMAFNNDGNRIQVKYNRLISFNLKVKFPSVNSVEMNSNINPIRGTGSIIFTFSTEYETNEFRNLLKMSQMVQWNHSELPNLQWPKGQIYREHNNGIGTPEPPSTPVVGNPGSSKMNSQQGLMDMVNGDRFHVRSSTYSSTTTGPQYSQSYDASGDFVFNNTTFSNSVKMNEGASSSRSSITNSWGPGSATTTDETPQEEQNDAQQQE